VSERLLTAAEVAELLAVAESWVRRETRAERIPHLALGRYRRYEWDAVVAWVESQRAGDWRCVEPRVEA
jgi:excisionase family DNA binding protein